jgi:hypothetical protein
VTLVAGSVEFMVFDRDGKKLFTMPPGYAEWMDDNTLLTISGTGAEIVSRVRLSDGTRTPLGAVPAMVNSCRNSADRLVCPGDTGVRI